MLTDQHHGLRGFPLRLRSRGGEAPSQRSLPGTAWKQRASGLFAWAGSFSDLSQALGSIHRSLCEPRTGVGWGWRSAPSHQCSQVWGHGPAAPRTEDPDFWVVFLRRDGRAPLKAGAHFTHRRRRAWKRLLQTAGEVREQGALRGDRWNQSRDNPGA